MIVPPVPMPATKWVMVAVCLAINFRPGIFIVGLRIHRIKILVRFEIFLRIGFENLTAHANGSVRTLHRIAVNDFGTVGADDLFTLNADVGRNHQLDRITEHAADHRQGDAGVAGSRVENGLAGLKLAACEDLLAPFSTPAGLLPSRRD